MSLLLEALKKAELAKQGAGPGAEAGVEKAAAHPESPPADPVRSVMTRERLPDITQPLEILSDDLPSAGQKAPAPREAAPATLTSETFAANAAEPAPASAPGGAALAGQRAQAQQLFEVKGMNYNPQRPFYLTLGALALAAAGYGAYLWWQLQPKANFNAQVLKEAQSRAASTSASAAPPGAPPVQAPPSQAVPAAPQALPTPLPAVPAVPAQAAATPPLAAPPLATPPVATPAPATSPTRVTPAAPRSSRPLPQMAPPAVVPPTASGPTFTRREVSPGPAVARPAQRAPRPPIAVNPPALVADGLLDQAYEAFQRDDLAAARTGYQRALAREPANRDALLGLAAIDLRTRNYESAEVRYLKLLEIDPRDAHALAGVIALRGQVDPVLSESRLKTLIASQPDATHLYFTLGNQYALQSRWSEAQAAYFKAYSADPENADYAFNLAISHDQMRQRQPALEYYRRSLVLAEKRPASFDRAQVQGRIQELGR